MIRRQFYQIDTLRETKSVEERLQWYNKFRRSLKRVRTFMPACTYMTALEMYVEFSTDSTLLKTPNLGETYLQVRDLVCKLGPCSIQELEEVEPDLRVQTERLKKLGVL